MSPSSCLLFGLFFDGALHFELGNGAPSAEEGKAERRHAPLRACAEPPRITRRNRHAKDEAKGRMR